MQEIRRDLLGTLYVVHIATYGEVSGDLEETYVLAFDGRLTMNRLRDYVGLFRFRDTASNS